MKSKAKWKSTYPTGQELGDAAPERQLALPSDTAKALPAGLSACKNLGLLLDKFAPWEDANSRWDLTFRTVRRKKDGTQESMLNRASSAKGLWLRSNKSNSKDDPPLNPQNRLDSDLIGKALVRWQASVNSLGGEPIEPPLSPDYRLVIGFGAEHVLETNLCLHRIYGFPIIPGSAVKGITRAWVFWGIAERLGVPCLSPEEAEQREKDKRTPLQKLDQLLCEGSPEKQEAALKQLKEDKACQSISNIRSLSPKDWQAEAADFYRVFGTTERRGEVIFFDAYPTQTPTLKLDILNPHYGEYYRNPKNPKLTDKLTPPADYLNPVPTYFLTVDRGSAFQFALACKDKALADQARKWLLSALSELGVGGKTSAGYGFMKVP
jgi:CRISPR-associated protein Cmr6